jgi:anthranilate synthase component 2
MWEAHGKLRDCRARGSPEIGSAGSPRKTVRARDCLHAVRAFAAERLSRKLGVMVLMIDNYDSFTYNLVQYFGELGEDVQVVRNDALSVRALTALSPSAIVISPGPCTPNEAGVSLDVIGELAGRVPIFGVCLGHQAFGQAFGGKVVRAREIMHGKTSLIHHDGKGVFKGVPNPFEATRYHSLIVEKSTLPECLEVSAWTVDANGERDEIMGLRHKTLAIEGVQFHPESILTQHGHALLRNFLDG